MQTPVTCYNLQPQFKSIRLMLQDAATCYNSNSRSKSGTGKIPIQTSFKRYFNKLKILFKMLQTKGFQNVTKYLRWTVLRRKLTYFSYVFDRVLNKPLRDNLKTLFMFGKISRKTEILRNVSRHKSDKYFLSQKVYYVKNFLILVKRFDKRLV